MFFDTRRDKETGWGEVSVGERMQVLILTVTGTGKKRKCRENS